VGLDARHLLPENHRYQRLEDRPSLGKPEAGMAAVRLGDERMERAKPGVVIIFTAKLRCALRGPVGSRPPRLDFDLAVPVRQVHGGRTFGCESCAPHLAIAYAQRHAGADWTDGQR
jgi:hypothetical protein